MKLHDALDCHLQCTHTEQSKPSIGRVKNKRQKRMLTSPNMKTLYSQQSHCASCFTPKTGIHVFLNPRDLQKIVSQVSRHLSSNGDIMECAPILRTVGQATILPPFGGDPLFCWGDYNDTAGCTARYSPVSPVGRCKGPYTIS